MYLVYIIMFRKFYWTNPDYEQIWNKKFHDSQKFRSDFVMKSSKLIYLSEFVELHNIAKYNKGNLIPIQSSEALILFFIYNLLHTIINLLGFQWDPEFDVDKTERR